MRTSLPYWTSIISATQILTFLQGAVRCHETRLPHRPAAAGGPGSGEAEGAGGGGEGADRGGEPVEGGVREGEEEEEEEEDAQQVGGENCEALGVLQRRADGGETHVVTEGVTENRTHQVTCNTDSVMHGTSQNLQKIRAAG